MCFSVQLPVLGRMRMAHTLARGSVPCTWFCTNRLVVRIWKFCAKKKHAHALLCARKIAQIQKSSMEFISDLKFLEFVQNPLHKHWSGLGIGRIRRDSCRHERTGNCRGFRIFCRNRKRTITELGKKDFEISKLTQTFYSFICTSEK